jgi:hypothetical protein
MGRAMARLYLKFDTVKTLATAGPPTTLEAAVRRPTQQVMTSVDHPDRGPPLPPCVQLGLVASVAEFSDFRFQSGNKSVLNALNKSKEAPVRFRLKGLVRTVGDKVNLLLQATLGGLKIEAYSLQQEAQHMLPIAQRVAKGVLEQFRAHWTATVAAHQLYGLSVSGAGIAAPAHPARQAPSPCSQDVGEHDAAPHTAGKDWARHGPRAGRGTDPHL